MAQPKKTRPKFFKKRSQKPFEIRDEEIGSPPGTLISPKVPRREKARITVIDYTAADFHEFTTHNVEDCAKYKDTPTVTWINIDAVDDIDTLAKLGEYFGLHPLALEDIQDTDQRPKLEEYESSYLIVTKHLALGEMLFTEQISMILGGKYVITVMLRESQCLRPVRDRLKNNLGKIRSMGSDYLAYSILDLLTDEYYPILETFGEELERLEESVIRDPRPHTLQKVQGGKRDLLTIRRAIWPNRGILNKLMRESAVLIKSDTRHYIRDCYDNTIQIIDIIETYRDMSSSLQDLYLSSISQKMNEVMKVLTIIATIFIPLTFITGLYGMNFEIMPELHWRWGYYLALSSMAFVALFMLGYFKKKRWL